MTPEKVFSLIFMLGIAACVFSTTYPWHELSKWGRIAVAIVVLMFGLPPLVALCIALVALWITGVF